MNVRKPFSRRLYNKFDEKAKKYARSLLRDFKIESPKNKMTVDLIVKDKQTGEFLFYVETEIKKHLGSDFKFKTLHLPERKDKFCHLDQPTLFILFSEDGKHNFFVWSYHVLSSPLKEVKNRFVPNNEMFFNIDLSLVDNNLVDALKRHKKRRNYARSDK